MGAGNVSAELGQREIRTFNADRSTGGAAAGLGKAGWSTAVPYSEAERYRASASPCCYKRRRAADAPGSGETVDLEGGDVTVGVFPGEAGVLTPRGV